MTPPFLKIIVNLLKIVGYIMYRGIGFNEAIESSIICEL
jgi:hypothetical protein